MLKMVAPEASYEKISGRLSNLNGIKDLGKFGPSRHSAIAMTNGHGRKGGHHPPEPNPPTSLSVERARLMHWAYLPIHFIHLFLLGSEASS